MPEGPASSPPSRPWTALGFSLVLTLALGALLFPSILDGHAVSSADLLAHHSPWRDSSLQEVVPEGEHSDPVFYFDPWFRFARDSLQHGGPPLRNPLSSLGVPFLANSQSALYSPFTLPYYLLEEGTATWVAAFLKLFLAGLGAFLLARRLGRSGLAAGVAGLGFSACGFLVLWLSFPLSSALVPLPWALLGVKWLRDRPIAGTFTLALAIATAVLGGHPECAFHTGVATVVFLLRELWLQRGREGGGIGRLVLRFALGGLAGGLLAGPQMLPFLAYLDQSGALEVRSDPEIRALRMAHPPPLEDGGLIALGVAALLVGGGLLALVIRRARAPEEGSSSARAAPSLPWLVGLALLGGVGLASFVLISLRTGAWNGLPLLLDPHFYGVSDARPGSERYVGPVNAIELNGGYLGATLLLLALLAPALCGPRERAAVRFRLLFFLACVFVSFDIAPFSQALFQIKPFDVVVNRRLLGEAALLGALLAADSFDGLRSARSPRAALLLTLALLVAGVGVFTGYDARSLPVRDGHGPLLERLSRPLGSPCAAIATPRARAAIPGDELHVRGYLVSLEGHEQARVRLRHRETGATVEAHAELGLAAPTPQDENIRQFPDADRSGFEAVLDLADFPGGDADVSVLLPASTGNDSPILQYRVRVLRHGSLERAWWSVPASLVALLLCGLGIARARVGLRRVGLLGLAGVALFDLGSHAWQHVPQIPRERLYPEFPELPALREGTGRVLPSAGAQEVLRPNAHMAYGLSAIEGVDVLGSRRATELVNGLRDQARDRSPLGNALRVNLQNPGFALLGVDRLLVPREVPVAEDEAELLFEGPALKVLRPRTSPIRAAFYSRWLTRPEDVPFDQWLADHDTSAREILLFSPEAEAPPCPAELAPSAPVETRLLHDHPDEIQVEVGPGPAGWLLVTDLYSPDFVAESSGESRRVLPGYDHLLAVELPARSEPTTLILRYDPLSHRLGLAAFGLGALLLVLGAGWEMRRRRRARAQIEREASLRPVSH